MTVDTGKIRVVDYHTPWLPPRAFQLAPDGSTPRDWTSLYCGSELGLGSVYEHLTPEQRELTRKSILGFVCTRTHHAVDEVHVCHYHEYADRHSPAYAVVWGGE